MTVRIDQIAAGDPPIAETLIWAEETMAEGPSTAPTAAAYSFVPIVQRSSRSGAFQTGTGVWPNSGTERVFAAGTGTWLRVGGKSVYSTGSAVGARNVGLGASGTWRWPLLEDRSSPAWAPDWRDLLVGVDVRVRQTVDASITEFQFGVVGGNGMIGFLGTNYGAVLASRSNLDGGRFHLRSRKTEGGAELPIGPDLGVGLGDGLWHVLGMRYRMGPGVLTFLFDGQAIATLPRGGAVLPFVPGATLNPVVGFGFGAGLAANDRVLEVAGHRGFIVAETDPSYV